MTTIGDEKIDHGMGVTSVHYDSPTTPEAGWRTYDVDCGTCGKHLRWTTTTTNVASELSDADWYPAGGYKDNDLYRGAQGEFWLCSDCGPYAPRKTAIPAAFRD